MLKLNTHRTFKATVDVVSLGEEGNVVTGSFGATFNVMPATEIFSEENKERRYLDIVLRGVDEADLDIRDQDGNKLEGDKLLEALKTDPDTASAIKATYDENIGKKGQKRT